MAAVPSNEQARVCEIARQMISGEISLIDGCREINDLRWDLDNGGLDRRFDDFVEFERRCFTIPPAKSRHLWSKKALERCDALETEIIAKHGAELRASCKRLLDSYKDDA